MPAEPVTIATAPLPQCCKMPVLSVNETMEVCGCQKCRKVFNFVGKTWVEEPAEKPAK